MRPRIRRGERIRRRWTSLLKQLCDGIRDDDDVLLVPGIPRDHAGHVLALLELARDHGVTTGERLAELLPTEEDLLHERARLYETVARLPVDAGVRATLAGLHADLRRAYDWLAEHVQVVAPVLGAHAPAGTAPCVARSLGSGPARQARDAGRRATPADEWRRRRLVHRQSEQRGQEVEADG